MFYDTDPGMGNYMTTGLTITGTTAVATLTAEYDALGRFEHLTDAYGRSAQVGVAPRRPARGGSQSQQLAE